MQLTRLVHKPLWISKVKAIHWPLSKVTQIQHFKTSFPKTTLGQLKPNFVLSLHGILVRLNDGVGRQTQWWPRHKAIYFSWFGPELFCLLLGPPGFNCWFSSAPVFQWCCSTPQGSPGVGRHTFLSSPHLCFIIVFICDLFVSRDDPLMS